MNQNSPDLTGTIIDDEERHTLSVPLCSLVARLQQGTPDRELDTLIWLSVVPGTTRTLIRYVHRPTGRPQEIDETRELQPDGRRRLITVPRYTESLDAAIGLIPTGYVWGCGFSRFVPHKAWISSSRNADGQFIGECDDSRAIALCIAAVKAIAASAGEIL